MAAINRAMQFVSSEIVVFSDANTLLNADAVINIVKHYTDAGTGGVAGEKKIVMPVKGDNYLGIGEGIYWQYESAIKQVESDFYTVIAAAGELFSIRTKLFKPLPDDTVLDDFMLGMHICKEGYIIKYEKDAFATEYPSANISEERKRKIRIGAGAAQAFIRIGLPSGRDWLLNTQYFSRRVIRWVISPIALILVLLCNIFICLASYDDIIYDYLLLLQLIFYCMAVFGLWAYYTRQRSVAFLIPFYFVFMNWCMLVGFCKQIFKRQPVLWEKSKRIQQNATPTANIN
jgi:cellulose synthase/poly-beta-1,6-N-acetylglucosamine synthase-like glycosyltransferase